MKKSLSSKMQSRISARAVQELSRKKRFTLALSTFLIVVVVSEIIRLALLNG
jgi:hypothetical protein